MATSSEQQTLQIQAFPCYTKRKLDTEESSMSLVYENGIFTPRSEVRLDVFFERFRKLFPLQTKLRTRQRREYQI